jgi:hypothetical protein
MWETRFVGVAAVGEQPVDLVTDDVAALLDAAVVAVGRGVNGLRHGSGRIGEKVNDVLMQNRSVGLQRETRGAQPAAACSAGGTSTNSCRTRFTSAASLTKAKSTKAGIRLPHRL